jgi:hypothetical protein
MSGWEGRTQSELQLSNGRLLATFDPNGEVDQFYAPHIDAFRARVGAFRTSVLVPSADGSRQPELIRIEPGAFNIRLHLQPGCQVLVADYHHKYRPLKLQRKVGLHPTEALMLDTWKVMDERAGLLHESIPWLGHSTSGQCSLYHPTFNGLVHHRDRRWLGVMVRGGDRAPQGRGDPQWVRVGHLSDHDRYRLWSGERVGPPIGAQDLAGFPAGPASLGWDQVVQGPATWGAFAVGPAEGSGAEAEIEFAVICADSERGLGELLEQTSRVSGARFFQMLEGVVSRRHLPARPLLERVRNPRVRELCERSIDVLHGLQDAGSGALMAAAEVDPHSRMSGGYGYSWPRDGAYLAAALGQWGFRERVEHYFKFCAETQDPSGAWWQRYLATGNAGPSWGRIQIDEPASVISAAWLHYKTHQDLFWLEGFWPVLQKGLSFLESFHAPIHPMGLPSHDLWEERMGIHAYSLAAVASAFRAGAALAGELGEKDAQEHYSGWASNLSSIIHEKFLPPGGPIKRSYVVNSYDYQRGGGYWDEAADASLLGLILPFGVLRVQDEAARKLVSSVRERLWSRPVGGVLRYEGDAYRGGNPWVLTTLWLASVELLAGNAAEARECFGWVMAKNTPLGMMPEQVHRETGLPCWVIPLGWSHAMFLLFVRQVLDMKAEGGIWENL